MVLGGTRFVGRAVVSAALARGWEVATFNRGLSGTDVPGVDAFRGDRHRSTDLEQLTASGPWDAVVDTNAYVPRNTAEMTRRLKPVATRYILMSTVSVYADWPASPLTEASTVLDCPSSAGPDYGPPDVEDGPTRYGRLKSGCEHAVLDAFGPSRSSLLRAGVVLGPGEYVGRLPWWLRRIAAGGRVLAPGSPDRAIQPVDVRDLAGFAVELAGGAGSGPFNVAAPMGRSTFADLLGSCAQVTGTAPTLVWVADRLLLQLGVRQWSELPLWRTFDGVWKVDPARAIASGFSSRPLLETVSDTWSWMQDVDLHEVDERSAELGISTSRELEILDRAS